ncbi:MAG: CoA-binding protein [Thermodesulfobacteriota bacterium]|jgi:acyl-CoA synthetase (NDP forming)
MEKTPPPDFGLLFNPKSIALIGASNNIGKWGAIVFLNILLGGYQGRVYPVNIREEAIFGHKAYAKVSQIPDPVDLAIIAIPAHLAMEAVLDSIRKGIHMAIVITSDFSETGEEGARLEKELIELARGSGMRLVGPNTMGIFSASANLSALMPPVRPRKGRVSLVSQSGNIGTQMLAWGEKFAVGFSKYVSSGNEGDLRSEDYLSFLGKDPETKVILTYIEGLDDGRRFLEIVKGITPFKPIIAFKGGKTLAGARAAKSHSGAMAGVSELYEAAFRQAGILWASTTEEMLELAAAFSFLPLPRGNRVGILTRGGGWGVIAADACVEMGLEVPPLEDALIRALDKILPSYWSKGNPVDMVASISMEAYLSCLEILISWEKVDAVISLSGDTSPLTGILSDVKKKTEGFIPAENLEKISSKISTARMQINQRLRELIELHKKPILAVGSNLVKGEKEAQPDFSLPQFRTPERAANAAGRLYQYSRYRSAIGTF